MVKNRLWSRVAEVRIKWVTTCEALTAMLAISVEVSTTITILVGMVVVIILLLSSSVDLLRNLLSSLTGETPPFTLSNNIPFTLLGSLSFYKMSVFNIGFFLEWANISLCKFHHLVHVQFSGKCRTSLISYLYDNLPFTNQKHWSLSNYLFFWIWGLLRNFFTVLSS